MVDYLDEFGTVSPDSGQRAVGVRIRVTATLRAGDQVTVDLSSLDFSRNETAAGSVDVSFGGLVLATQPVDRVYTPTLDEIGKATVTFAIPAGTSGPTRFGVSVPATGTTSSFQVNVG